MNIEVFRNPGAAYRGKPFWAWNGKLDPDELRRQVRVLHRMGLGGGFMHSRVGLATPYLGPEWFECVKATIDECRKLGMEAWLYDEDRWPSGAAGGLVTRNKAYRMRSLKMEVLKGVPRKTRGLVRVARGKVDGCHFEPGKGRHALAFRVELQAPSPWYNDQTYLDTLSAEAVKQFIEKGYRPYAGEIGAEFGGTVPGVFTDEPNYGHSWGQDSVPWTDKLPAEFKKRYGYDLLDHLPALFFEMKDERAVQVRCHYFNLITALFTENFAGLIGRWCGKHNLQFTGHVLMEETLRSQRGAVGAAMRFYEHMQAPGIDILTQYRREVDTAKQCDSVRHQVDRHWMLSELYGCTGWDFSFEGHKAIGDWQAALGVNLRCQHLAWYTMLGQAKRDYPASISFQSPWWQEYPVVEDYFARITSLLTQGEPVRDVLVIHPIESGWLAPARPSEQSAAAQQKQQEHLEFVRDTLLEHQIDFDYGDEEMLSRLAKVGRGRLRVGKGSYTAVVVPPTLTLRLSTLRLLDAFARSGGKVIFVKPLAQLVDALPSDEVEVLADRCTTTGRSAAALVKRLGPERTVRLSDKAGRPVKPVLVMRRKTRTGTVLFICNTDRKKGFDRVDVELYERGTVEEWDASSGDVWRVAKNSRTFTTSLPASGSRLFVIGAKSTPGAKARPAMHKARERRLPAAAWPVVLDEPNAVVLDTPRVRIGDGRWSKPIEVLRADRQVREALGVRPRGGQMVQPWARPKVKRPKSIPVQIEYTFEIRDLPGGPLALALETPERFKVTLNGLPLGTDETGAWWVDPCLAKLPVPPAALVKGTNTLSLHIDYTEDDGLEACFLLGPFGVRLVKNRPVVVTPPTRLRPGDWCRQGLPFYSGTVTYRMPAPTRAKKGERVSLRFDAHRSSVIRVSSGGKVAGRAAWPPYEVDVTDLLDGSGELCVELFSSRRNAFGPLHLADRRPMWVGPGSFETDGNQWLDAYQLVPYGLMKPPVVVTYHKD